MAWKMLKVKIDSLILNLGLHLTFAQDLSFLAVPLEDMVEGLKWIGDSEPVGAYARSLLYITLERIERDLSLAAYAAQNEGYHDLAFWFGSYLKNLRDERIAYYEEMESAAYVG